MRRRQFLSTLPLAAATPVLAQSSLPGTGRFAGQGWATVEAQTELRLAELKSSQVVVGGGSGPIQSLGPCNGGEGPRTLLFQGRTVLFDGPGLVLNNGGLPYRTRAGDIGTAYPTGAGVWRLVIDKGNTLLTKDSLPDRGGGTVRFGVPDDADTPAPSFLYNGGDAIPKFYCKAIFITSPGNQVQFAANIANGTAARPTSAAPGDVASFYAWAYNDDSTRDTILGNNARHDREGLNHNQYFDYVGRVGYVSIMAAETSTPTGRGGAVLFSTTPIGKVSTFASSWVSPSGNLCVAGRGRFEDGAWDYPNSRLKGPATYPFAQILKPGCRQSPGGFNPMDHHGWGNVSISGSHKTDNAAIAIRKYAEWGNTGFDFALDHQADELQLGMVKAGARTWRWGFGLEGHFMPVQDAAADIGAPGRRPRVVYATEVSAARSSDGTVIEAQATGGRFASDLVFMNAAAPPGRGFNFWRGRAAGSNLCAARGDGHIHAQAFDTGGAGVSEFLEWADGNPKGEDRVGVTVVLEANKIRPARPDDAPERILGVVSARPGVVGNAASLYWRGKYALDAWRRPVTRRRSYIHWVERRIEPRQVERVREVSERIRPIRTETVMVEESEPRLVEVDGRWVQRMVQVKRPHERTVVRTQPLHDEEGRAVYETRARLDADGRPVLDLHTGLPIVDRAPVVVSVPVYDDEQDVTRRQTYVDVEDVEVKGAYCCFPADAIPAGVAPPEQAQVFELEEPALNPDFDEARSYASREDRPEWAAISFLGQELIRRGQPVGARWVRMGEPSPGIEQWLVR